MGWLLAFTLVALTATRGITPVVNSLAITGPLAAAAEEAEGEVMVREGEITTPEGLPTPTITASATGAGAGCPLAATPRAAPGTGLGAVNRIGLGAGPFRAGWEVSMSMFG